MASICIPSTFSPSVFGLDFVSIQANVVSNFSFNAISAYRYAAPSVQLNGATFCNVTVSYTHPGENDTVNLEHWLPFADSWNGRFQAQGGGGWVAGRFFLSYGGMAGALHDGFATSTTDAGLGSANDPSGWALLSPGNVNYFLLDNLGSRSLFEQSVIGKQVIEAYYNEAPKYSYWNGCSQGGRQGLAMAQQHPDAYDGILAGAPAIYWSELAFSIYWPTQVMNDLGAYPYGCEIDALTAAAIEQCDGYDEVSDGIISQNEQCLSEFDPFAHVGETIANCTQTGASLNISEAAAIVANATWNGYTSSNGERIWFGPNIGSDLTGDLVTSFQQTGPAATSCTTRGCGPNPSNLGSAWLSLFLEKSPDYNYLNQTREQLDILMEQSRREYNSAVGTTNPDLRRLHAAGGKIISFHGQLDQIIPTKATEHYYNLTSTYSAEIHDFFRYFPVPGLGHCFGGLTAQPTSLFSQLVEWVEHGTAPASSNITFTDPTGHAQNRVLCPYPQREHFDTACGNVTSLACWSCTL